jgi:hypothetical protein
MVDKFKAPVALYLGLDYFVEDRDLHALELKNITKVILVNQIWNTHIQDQFPTINHVSQLPELLKELESEKEIHNN